MGWKGTVRSLAAAARAAEREAQRRRKQAEKEQMWREASDAVFEWEQHVESLVSLHTRLVAPIDWQAIATKPEPQKPAQKTTHEDAARGALEKFKPSVFDIFRGGSERIKENLIKNISIGTGKDFSEYQNNIKTYDNEFKE